MAFSFDPALKTDKDLVRILIGDISTSTKVFEDETIEGMLGEEMNPYMTAAALSEIGYRLQTGGAAVATRKVGETTLKYQTLEQFKINVDSLRNRGRAYQTPEAGGVYKSETDEYEDDDDLLKGKLFKGLGAHPGVPDLGSSTT